MKILNEAQENILARERKCLSQLQMALIEFNAKPEDLRIMSESITQLDDLFLLVVVGEFNSGKSAFINALLGERFLKEGVTPTTTQVNVLRYGDKQDRIIVNEQHHILYLPIDWLSEISIVDTPGTNAVIRAHEEITTQFVPQSDLVLFITSIDRPFSESERQFMENIRDWGKKVLIVINKIDILGDKQDLDEVIKYISENALVHLGISPEIFPISSKYALLAKLGDDEKCQDSQFETLENYILNKLDEKDRFRLKLLNPFGIGINLTEKYQKIIFTRMDLLKDDIQMISDVESELDLYKEDMFRDFNFRMSDIENVLFEMEQRGDEYFDATFRLARVFDLINKERIQREYETQVIADVPQQIDQKVNELIDWLVEADLRQWQNVSNHLAERRRVHQERIVGGAQTSSFHYQRDRLIDAIGRNARRVIETYNKEKEAELIAENAQIAVAASAALEIGAVGLGTLVAVLATTAAADVTGILLASLIAALGLIIIPTRKRIVKNELREKIAGLRLQLVNTIRNQFQKEIDQSRQRINEAIAPYTRFVRSENEKLSSSLHSLNSIKNDLEKLRVEIEEI